MLLRPPIYGLDILIAADQPTQRTRRPGESLTLHSVGFMTPPSASKNNNSDHQTTLLDPATSSIAAASISTPDGDEYYNGDEARILRILDQRFAVLEPGVVATWHGSILDLPFLAARSHALDIELGLRLKTDTRRGAGVTSVANGRQKRLQIGNRHRQVRYGVCAAWHAQRHLDLKWVYRRSSKALSLNSGTDELTGLDPRRGAHLARSLAERRWRQARRHLDRVLPPTKMASYAWTCLTPELQAGPDLVITSRNAPTPVHH